MTMDRPASTADAIAMHLRYLGVRQLSPGTIYQRRRHLIRLHAFLAKDLLDLDVEDIAAWHEQLNIGPQATVTAIAHVTEFFRWAIRHDILTADPTRFIIRPRIPRGLPRPISEEDLQLAIDTAPARIRAWLVLAGWGGLRACEVANLHRSDILDSATPAVIIVKGKGNRERVVPLGPAMLMELQAYGLTSRGYVFARRDGNAGPNKPYMISHLANAHLHALGITATFHQLRHRYGTQIHGISKDLRVTQELLGHSSPATTAGYAAYSRSSAIAAATKLDQTLLGPAGQTALPLDLGALTQPRNRRRV
jgi:integrase/recombinase XerC